MIDPLAALESAHRRLEQLLEIGKLFARFETLERTLEPALALAARALPLRSAVLIETDDGHSTTNLWASEGQASGLLTAAKEHAEAAHVYLTGAASVGSWGYAERRGSTVLPRPEGLAPPSGRRFIVLPLVVEHRPPFGALQLEGAEPFQKADLIFVNVLANQLALALHRRRAWRREIARREHAEAERTAAQVRIETAERAVRQREQVLSAVAHDLKNPLTTILLATHFLEDDGDTADPAHGLPGEVVLIRRSAERMLRQINDLLDFASIDAGHLRLDRRPRSVDTLIQEAIAAFEEAAKEKGLRLTGQLEERLPQLVCDPDRLFQVFSNLIGNAIKVVASGGHIALRVEKRGGEVVFSVADSGPGIRPEDVPHLFKAYWRSDEARYRGTGLGLAIARGIVSAHGGRIWVETELGRGTTFFFSLPTTDG